MSTMTATILHDLNRNIELEHIRVLFVEMRITATHTRHDLLITYGIIYLKNHNDDYCDLHPCKLIQYKYRLNFCNIRYQL